MKIKINSIVHIGLIITTVWIFLGWSYPAAGETLKNERLKVVISDNGQLQNIQDIRGKFNYPVESDYFTVVTNLGTFSNNGVNALRMEKELSRQLCLGQAGSPMVCYTICKCIRSA